MFSDWNLRCLRSMAFSHAITPPLASRGKPEIVPTVMYKSVLKLRGLTSAAVVRPSTSPLLFGFSAGRGRRTQSTGTCAAPCHQEAALELRTPRNEGTSVVVPVPYD